MMHGQKNIALEESMERMSLLSPTTDLIRSVLVVENEILIYSVYMV